MSKNYMETWKKNSIMIGAPTNLLAAITAFFPVIYLCIKFNCWPDANLVLAGWGLVALSYASFYIVEPVSYYASLGLAGTYLGFLSGNVGNMRIPCAALALDVTKSEPGTIQAEIVSTMAICGSIITNLIATTAAAICGVAVIAVLPEALRIGLQNYAATAIYGATFGNFALKKPNVAIFALLIPIACKVINGLGLFTIPAWLIIVLSVFGTVIIARLLYQVEKKK